MSWSRENGEGDKEMRSEGRRMQHEFVVSSYFEEEGRGEVPGGPAAAGPFASAQSAATGPELCLHTLVCLLFSIFIA